MLSRREFLALPVLLALARPRAGRAETAERRLAYVADVGILYNALRFRMEGTISQRVDPRAGRYAVTIAGGGGQTTSRVDSVGVLVGERWVPVRSSSRFVIYGRESRLDVAYDPVAGRVRYRSRSETFLLRRPRVVDDVVTVPERVTVDDVVTASLNYAGGRWQPEPGGVYRTHVLRRRRAGSAEGEDAGGVYGAELVPLTFRVVPDPETGAPSALLDLAPFSSWAREDAPARVVFAPDGRPELISSALILGSSLVVRIAEAV